MGWRPGRARQGDGDAGAEAERSRRRGTIIAVLSLLLTAVLLGHRYVPNTPGNMGSLLETFLPWVGIPVFVLIVCALLRRSKIALAAVLIPVLAWGWLFGNLLLPGKGGGHADLRVLTHNVDAGNHDPTGTARDVLAAKPDVLALEELTYTQLPDYEKVLDVRYHYHYSYGTVGLWSRYPITDKRPVDIGMAWGRALRAVVHTPEGDVAFYVAHLASVRVGTQGFTSDQRNRTINALGDQIAADTTKRVVLLGDLNGTVDDRELAPITAGLRSVQAEAGSGFGFTWPAGFPMARIDQILVRGVSPTRAWVLPRTGSDHRPIAADLRL